jgi:SAM-dependent methyltransferase
VVVSGSPEQKLREGIDSNPHWYHSIELAPGVVTPGQVDLRDIAGKILPVRLEGKRALDLGTFDGFWAFELESRGAEVVATDLPAIENTEWPPIRRDVLLKRAKEWDVILGRGFRIAAEALGSSVRRIELSAYDLSPDAVGGHVDFLFSGAILLHLRDPVRALERMRETLRPGGTLVMFEPFSTYATLRSPRRPIAEFKAAQTEFNWWYSNVAALRAWPIAAGFVDVRRLGLHRPRTTKAMRAWHLALSARAPA